MRYFVITIQFNFKKTFKDLNLKTHLLKLTNRKDKIVVKKATDI